jgi:rare lipoprotein A
MRNLILAMVSFTMLGACATKLDDAHIVTKSYHLNATWYMHGSHTANGERFNPNGYTAAHKTLPFGTLLRVTNSDDNRSIVVRVNDRGPFTKGVDLDIARGGAQELGLIKKGRAKVFVEELITSR